MTCQSLLRVMFSSLLLSLPCTAMAANELIECPSAKFVSKLAERLDTIHILPKSTYHIYSEGNPIYEADTKRYWALSTMVVTTDLNDAFLIANENVNTASVQWDKYAKQFDGYYCKYTGSDAGRVMYLITQEEGRLMHTARPGMRG